MAPALLRFYGGSAQEWQATPWPVALQFYGAIPRILVREAGSSPPYPDFDMDKMLEELQEAAGGQAADVAQTPAPKRGEKPKSMAEMQYRLSKMGFKVDIQ